MVGILGEFTSFVLLKRSPLEKGEGKPRIYLTSALIHVFLLLPWLTVQEAVCDLSSIFD